MAWMLSFVRASIEGLVSCDQISLAKALIGSFSSRQHRGRPRSMVTAHLDRPTCSLAISPCPLRQPGVLCK